MLFCLKIYVGTATSIGGIWDEFSEQHPQQSLKKSTIFNAELAFFGANKLLTAQ